jgi:thiamine-monophosphate kinase
VNEAGRIAMLARLFSSGADAVEVGIGDDAAVLETPGDGRLVWTIDEQVEGTHFRRDLLSWHDVGWRSFMAAASDLAAMGARPWCALAALVLPADVDDAALEALVRGQRAAAEAVGAPVIGGNLARGPVLSIATTLLGKCERPVLRSGARPGDGLWLAGRVGLAAAGFQALSGGKGEGIGDGSGEGIGDGKGAFAALRDAVAAWRTPHALVAEGRAMASVARAAIDVSDGLARDVGHVAEASGVGIVIEARALLDDPLLVAAAAALGADAVDLALRGGEDYALVAASPTAIDGFRRLGEVTAGRGLVLRTTRGDEAIAPGGFDHFAT